MFIISFGLAGFAAYDKFYNSGKHVPTPIDAQKDEQLPANADSTILTADKPIVRANDKPKQKTHTPLITASHKPRKKWTPNSNLKPGTHKVRPDNEFTILHTAYFYDAPDKNNRSDIYLTPGDATLTLTDESGEFRYAIFTDDNGKAIKGWLLKKDFKIADDN
jgi:hypothetical protein